MNFNNKILRGMKFYERELLLLLSPTNFYLPDSFLGRKRKKKGKRKEEKIPLPRILVEDASDKFLVGSIRPLVEQGRPRWTDTF